MIALLAVMDAAALDMTLRPTARHAEARFLLSQGTNCFRAVSYPMRRVEADRDEPGIDEPEFHRGVERLQDAGFPVERSAHDAWNEFASLRSRYAPYAYQLAYWTVAAPAPWSGERAGFPGLVDWPDAPESWSLD